MTYKTTLFSCLCAASLALSACGDIGSKPSSNSSTGGGVDLVNSGTQPGGGFGGGGGGSFDSDFDDATPVGDLGIGEIAMTCNQFEVYISDRFGGTEAINEGFCDFFGYFTAVTESQNDAEARQICTTVRDDCLTEEQDLDIGCPFRDAEGCEVTVGEIEACATAQTDVVEEAFAIASCNAASFDPESLEGFDFDNIPECKPLNECGDILIEETDPEPMPGG